MSIKRLVAVLFALLLGAAPASAALRSNCAQPDNENALIQAIADGLNASRVANGLQPLSFNRKLSRAAMSQACDMITNGFFDHTGSDGSSVMDRAVRAGCKRALIAENLAWGYPRPEQIIDGWMHSPGHRSNMLLPRVNEFGVGIASSDKGPFWVLVVAGDC